MASRWRTCSVSASTARWWSRTTPIAPRSPRPASARRGHATVAYWTVSTGIGWVSCATGGSSSAGTTPRAAHGALAGLARRAALPLRRRRLPRGAGERAGHHPPLRRRPRAPERPGRRGPRSAAGSGSRRQRHRPARSRRRRLRRRRLRELAPVRTLALRDRASDPCTCSRARRSRAALSARSDRCSVPCSSPRTTARIRRDCCGAVGYGAMPAVHLVCDSTADLDPAFRAAHTVRVVPAQGDLRRRDLQRRRRHHRREFYKRLAAPGPFPRTSQPTPAEFEAVFRELGADGGSIVCTTISADLQRHVRVGDAGSRRASGSRHPRHRHAQRRGRPLRSGPRGGARDRGRRRRRHRWSRRSPRWEAPHRVLFTVETLEFLRRGGRIGGARALLGSMLDIKPILEIRDGVIEPVGRVRTYPRAIDRVVDECSTGGDGLGRRRAGDRPRRPAEDRRGAGRADAPAGLRASRRSPWSARSSAATAAPGRDRRGFNKPLA